MTTVTVFRHAPPPLVGVLGVVPDPASEALEQNLDWLEATGVLVEGFDPYRKPVEAARFQAVTESLARDGPRCLPLFLVDGEVVSTGMTSLAPNWPEASGSTVRPRSSLVNRPQAAKERACIPTRSVSSAAGASPPSSSRPWAGAASRSSGSL
jgi:hypothetical protein